MTRIAPFVLVVLAALAVPAWAGDSILFVPPGVDLQAHPLRNGPLTVRDAAGVGLRPMALRAELTVYNWQRKPGRPLVEGRFVVETLSPQTLVYVDGSGTPVYKADCGNRIALWLPHVPPAPKAEAESPAEAQPENPGPSAKEPGVSGWMARRGRAIGGLVDGGLDLVGQLFGWLYRTFFE